MGKKSSKTQVFLDVKNIDKDSKEWGKAGIDLNKEIKSLCQGKMF